jgi:cytochrome c
MVFRNGFITVVFVYALIGVVNAATPDEKLQLSRGQRLFLQCKSCHEIADTKIIKTGPNLKGVVGRAVASYPGFSYSKSLQSLAFKWDEEQLGRWLEKPSQIAPATTMAYGLPNVADRKAVIAYLRSVQ